MRKFNTGLASSMLVLAVLAGLSTPAFAQGEIDFGDDSSAWANDGECDDPRFTGAGMAEELEDADLMHDASDCRTAFEAGTITLAEEDAPLATAVEPEEPAIEMAPAAEIDFGDDSSDWANDGECDDPRFTGAGMAEELEDADLMRDASDCRTAFEAGTITLVPTDGDSDQTNAAIDFGDDTSEWANDQECDDPRFVGAGMAIEVDEANILRDATDCRNAFEDGSIRLDDGSGGNGNSPAWLAALAERIDFGDDSGEWPHDGECDDPDFVGPGAAAEPYEEDRLADASDCRAAFIAGTVTLRSTGGAIGFNYGSDFSEWAHDGECDDPRFTGPGMAKKLFEEDIEGDASDCRMLENDGQVSLIPVYHPDYLRGAPYDGSHIDFGDDSSDYANDELCDDPRFVGPGTAYTLLDSDRLADATDCRAAFEKGTIVLRAGES